PPGGWAGVGSGWPGLLPVRVRADGMSSTGFRVTSAQPLVAVVCAVPLLVEAVDAALESVAEVRAFPARGGDVAGLLRWLQPDLVIVDSDESAIEAAVVAEECGLPLVHISVRERALRVFRNGTWQRVGN